MSYNVVDHWKFSFNLGNNDFTLKSDAEPEVVVFGIETYVKLQIDLNVRYVRTSEMVGFSVEPIYK